MARTTNPRRPTRVLLAVLVAASVLAAACADDDGGGGDGGDAADDRERTVEPQNEATGTPIVVGMINQEDAPSGSFPEIRQGARTAVDYINADLGGVDGHPIQLEVCTTSGTPESSQACANELLELDPVAVVGGGDYGANTSVRVLEEAGIPYVGGSPASTGQLTSANSYMFSGGVVADLLGIATYAIEEQGMERVAVIYIDLPSLLRDAAPVVENVLDNMVESATIVAEKPDAADFAPALSLATENDPEGVAALFPAQGCSRIMQAREALGIEADFYFTSACIDSDVLEAADGAADGDHFASSYLPFTDEDDEDVAVYLEQLDARGPRGAEPSLLSQIGFSVAMNLQDLLSDAEGDPPTAESLRAVLDASVDRPNFMGHPYTCDREQVPLATAMCDSHVRMLRLDDGQFEDVAGEWITGADLIPG